MKRTVSVVMTAVATLGVGALVAFHPAPKLIWNASASVPVGLYTVHPAGELRVAELVVVIPPEPLATFLEQRHYLPKNVPLLKHIAALPGQVVCRASRIISLDGFAIGNALNKDRRGRALPVWQGCQTIADGQVFLMNPQSEDSLDGRYFGLLPVAAIVGEARPVWVRSVQ